MATKAERKAIFAEAVKSARAYNSEQLDIVKRTMLLIHDPNRPYTVLWDQEDDPFGDDPAAAFSDDWRERIMGLILDNAIYGNLPIDRDGKVLPNAEVPTEVMTFGGTALVVGNEHGHLTLTDPFGCKTKVEGIIVQLPNYIQCLTDKQLMVGEWLRPQPLNKDRKQSEPAIWKQLGQLSMSSRLLKWETFDLKLRSGGTMKVRSLLSAQAVERIAGEYRFFCVKCSLPGSEGARGKAPPKADLNAFEDRLLLKLSVRGPRTLPIAVTESDETCDFYFASEHNGALFGAIDDICGDFEFNLERFRISGDIEKILRTLTPHHLRD
jgi:hypothetical protein